MSSRFSLFLATALVLTASAAWAQRAGNESASQNVKESEAYDRLVCSNPSFRAKRIAQECGPLQGSEFYQSCVSTFDCGKAARAPNFRQAPASETVR